MKNIADIQNEYRKKIDPLDLELLICDVLQKPREFVLTHPEYEIPKLKIAQCILKIARRIASEPIAHILGHKEFYGLDFVINKHTLIPRPETEQLVGLAIKKISNFKFQISNLCVIDVGTGSGCIITSTAKNIIDNQLLNINYFGIDISKDALNIARKNARLNAVNKKISFLHGDLLSPFIQNSKFKIQNSKIIILANLPYLSREIYQTAPVDVRKYEPKTALYSAKSGLAHYEKLLKQLKSIYTPGTMLHSICLLEFSPEQKIPLQKLVRSIFPKAQITFHKDLAGKWRVASIEL